MDVWFKNIGLGEYTINDMLFNVLTLCDVGWPYEFPLVISILVPLGPLNNQTWFINVGHDCPSYQILKVESK